MSYQTTLQPINGKEAAEIIENQTRKFLSETPGLEMGRAYKRVKFALDFKLSAWPADVPTPSKEIEIVLDAPDVTDEKVQEHFNNIAALELMRNELVNKIHYFEERIEFIDQALNAANPVTSMSIELEAGDTPDNLRIDQGLKVPVITKEGGRGVETYVEVKKVGNTLQFGKKD